MKLKKLSLKNFAKFTDFEIEYDDNVTRLVGANGSGKTTVGCTAIWACLKGIAEKGRGEQLIGDRWRFIGGEKSSADVELTLVDEKVGAEIKVRNHITSASNKITFDAPDGYKISDDWLENLLSVSMMSAKNFSQMSSKDQSIALGINTERHDKKIRMAKEDYTRINREFRAFGEIPERKKVERVVISDLVREKDEIDKENQMHAEHRKILKENAEELSASITSVEKLNKELEEAKAKLSELTMLAEKAPDVPADIPVAEIVKKIETAEVTNDQAGEWERNEEDIRRKDATQVELEKNRDEQKVLAAKRIKYIKGALKVEVEGLEVDEDGGLSYNGKPIREPYFSKGELEIAVAKIVAATNPELKVRFIDDFELLDEGNQVQIVDDLLKSGFQIITAEIRTSKTKTGILTLRECSVKAKGE